MNNSLLPRILIVDDDENDYFLLSDLIHSIPEQKFIIEWTFSYTDSIVQMKAGNYDLYFIDYYLGGKTGLDLIEEAISAGCEEPLILLTGVKNRDIDVKAMVTGAVDYLVKSELSMDKLERCIRYSLERGNTIKALKANERKFHAIFEKSKDAIFVAGDDMFFKEINTAATELFAFSRQELLSIDLFSLITRENAACYLRKQLQQFGMIDSAEIELATKTGQKKNFLLSVSKEMDPEGHSYYQGILRDITSLKKIEKAQHQIEKLQSTALLLRTLAHEIRNPLTNISLAVSFLKSELNRDDQFVQIIERNLERINGLVTELLNSFKSGEINTQQLLLQDIIDNALEAARDRLALKDIRLIRNYEESDALIMGDREKLKMAFLNIIINAVEAMEEKIGVLTVCVTKEGSYLKVMIRDNGSGISEENLSKIFEPYYTSKSNGFGLGLAATLNILQSHKAFVDVESKIGKGTGFSINFLAFDGSLESN